MSVFNKKFLFIFLAIIFIIHWIAVWNGWYIRFFWFDIVLHLAGGAAVAIFIVLYFGNNFNENSSRLFIFLVLLSGTVLVGVFWEFFEWGFDNLVADSYNLPFAQPGLNDTMQDFVMDLFGASIVALPYIFFRKRDKRFKTPRNTKVISDI